MLRKIRIALAAIFFVFITLLLLDFTGTLHAWLGWMAKVQLVPAILAMNFIVVAALVVLTLVFGRVYCSVVCPLGVMQDAVSWAAGKRKKNRFAYSRALTWLRWTMLAVFVAMLAAGLGAWLEPYSMYGRVASNLFAPVYQWINNGLAYLAERADSYAFYHVDIWIRSGIVLAVAAVTFVVVAVLAWRNGRTWCNAICPVGTVLGFVSRFAILKPRIDTSKCNSCGLCARNCKASCIDTKSHTIDYSRCVACMDCIGKCNQDAMTYSAKKAAQARPEEVKAVDKSRRKFLSVVGIMAYAATVKAQEMKVDGGLALLEDKKIPDRATRLVPAGSLSLKNMDDHCTACQLCVSVCPNNILRPSTKLATLMKPEMSYERGFCRPECTKCSEVCPTGAIHAITAADKSATQIGHAVWIADNCVVLTDDVNCGNCERHCPAGAIIMVRSNPADENSRLIPAVNEERCIGCGACEYVCPSRPFSAIYVEGHQRHRTV